MIALVHTTATDAAPFLERFAAGRLVGLDEGETAQHEDVLITITGVGKMKATLYTERLLQRFDIDLLLHVGTSTALGDTVEIGSLVAAASVLEGDRISLTAPSYPQMPLATPDDLPTGTLVTHDHAIGEDEEAGYWQRLADMSDTTGYAVAYVAAQHGVACHIVKAVTGRFQAEQDNFQHTLSKARQALADFTLDAVNLRSAP
jgi:nucleoside phosphorylase